MSITKIREKVAAEQAGSGARQIGELVLAICEISGQAAELVAQDLEHSDMSLAKCFAALRAFAKKHQQGGAWCCGGVGIDPENPVIQVILEYFKIPKEWIGGQTAKPQAVKVNDAAGGREGALGHGAAPVDLLDLL